MRSKKLSITTSNVNFHVNLLDQKKKILFDDRNANEREKR